MAAIPKAPDPVSGRLPKQSWPAKFLYNLYGFGQFLYLFFMSPDGKFYKERVLSQAKEMDCSSPDEP